MKCSIRNLSLIAGILAGTNIALAAPNVYIPLGAANMVQVVDGASNQVIGTVNDVGNTHGLAVTPDGRYLVAGTFSKPAAGVPPKPAGMSEAQHQQHHAKKQTDKKTTAGAGYVSTIDTASRKVIRRVMVRGPVHHVAISADGKFAAATHPGQGGISVIDLGDFSAIATADTGSAPNYAAFSGDSRTLYVSNAGEADVSEIDTANWSLIRRLKTGKSPEHLVLSQEPLSVSG